MENMLFDTINRAWNSIRTSGQEVVPGVRDLSRVILQRTGEDNNSITIMFRGFDQALDDPDSQAPLVKRFLLSWIKKFAQAQIERGDPSSFILRLMKPMVDYPIRQQPPQPEPQFSESLVHISSVRKLNGR